jgi:hypothetical protein
MKTDSTLQEFFVAGGTLWREAPSYIIRPADEELFRLTLAGCPPDGQIVAHGTDGEPFA